MPGKRKARPKIAAHEPVAVVLRLPNGVLIALDAWLDELNVKRWPKLLRSELLRAIVADAVKHRRGAP